MNLTRVVPWKKETPILSRGRLNGDPFSLLHQQMDNLFEDFFGNQVTSRGERPLAAFAPQIDVSETANELRITAELPGIDEKDVEVAVEDNVLLLKGEKKQETTEENENHYHSERSYGYFERAVRLPESADLENVDAKFRNGLLKITIPKKPESQTSRRKIELKSE